MALVRFKATKSVTWWVGLATGLVSVAVLIEARGYGVAGIMPSVAAAAILGLSVLHTIGGLLFGVVANNEEWHSDEERRAYARRRWTYLAIGFGVCVAIWVLGFHITLPVFLTLFIGLSTRRWVLAVILAASMWVFTFVVLHGILHVAFAPSLLQRWLIAAGYY